MGLPVLYVLGPELFDDGGSGGGRVADRAAPDARLERTDQADRKAFRKNRKRLVEHQPHQFPVARDGILSRRRFSHAPERANGNLDLRRIDRGDAGQPERPKGGQAKGHRPGDVPQRVASLISVGGCVGKFAHANAVEHDQDDAVGGPDLAHSWVE